jgi:hypothetical protein
MNNKTLLIASTIGLVSAAVGSAIVAGVITGPVSPDSHTVVLGSASAVASKTSPAYFSCGVVTPPMPVDGSLDCIDPGHQLSDLFWTKWDDRTATGTGRIGVANCLCDSPKYTWYPVDVTLGDPRAVRNGEVFGTLTVRYQKARPAGAPPEKSYSLTNPDAGKTD